jgi:polysaccharide export outer membrane protein
VVFLFLVQGCGTSKGPFVPVEQMQAEAPARVAEFILGPGDKLEIIVYRHDDLKRTVQVDLSGKIGFPLIGDVQAAGLGIFEFRDKIRDGLAKYIIDPQVTVGVASSQSQKIIVLGEVKNPGFFQAESAITALEGISRAGGFTADGQKKSVLLIRGGMNKPQLIALNLEKALKEGDLAQNVALQRGDIVYVPRTFIADVDKFFTHMSTILQPLVLIETGIFLGQQIQRGGAQVTVAP